MSEIKINKNEGQLSELDQLSYNVISCVYDVYNKLGPGLLESIYEEAMVFELKKRNIKVESQLEVPVIYEGMKLTHEMRLDLLVDDKIIVELKSVEELKKVHFKQLKTYLKLAGKNLGLLINFNTYPIVNGIHRVVLDYKE